MFQNRTFRGRVGQSLLLSLGLVFAHRQAAAQDRSSNAEVFIELENSRLLTPGVEGVQIVGFENGSVLRAQLEYLEQRGDRLFLRQEAADALGYQYAQHTDRLEIESQTHPSFGAAPLGSIITGVGSIAGTIVLASALDDLSDDLVAASYTTLDDPEPADDPALDAEEDEVIEVAIPEVINQEPVFDEAPIEGVVNESAATDTQTAATVSATDADGEAMTFHISSQEVPNAFKINSVTGEISVSNSSLINFETHPTLDVTVVATDTSGGTASQTVTIEIQDDPTDTLSSVPTYTVSHMPFSSGALVLGNQADGTIRFGHGGIKEGTDEAVIELFLLPANYFFDHEYGLIGTWTASPFTALEEINGLELAAGTFSLSSTVAGAADYLSFDQSIADFTSETGFTSAVKVKNIDYDVSGVFEEVFTYENGTIAKLGTDGFTHFDSDLAVGPGDIIQFGDVTGDGLNDVIFKKLGTPEPQVYPNTGDGFSADPLEVSIFTGVDLDALAGGRALDFSVRFHFGTDPLSVLVLGTEETFFYDLT